MSTHGTSEHHDPDHPHDHDHDHDHGGVWARVRHAVAPHSHDAADSVDAELEGSARGIRAVKVSLVVLGLTALVQLAIVVVTGSVALLADTVHNFSDALTAVPLWVAFVLSRRSADRRYTYGYGRAEDLAGAFVVLMILLSAVVAGVESVRRLVDPVTIELPWAVLAAGVVGFVGNEAVAVYRIRVGRQIGSAALVADGVHARADGFTSLAVVAGALGVMAGFPLADPLVGLAITVAIVWVLRGAARDVGRRLMDAVDPDLVARAESVLLSVPDVVHARTVRMRWVGHVLRAEADLVVPAGLSLTRAHEVAHAAEAALVAGVPRLTAATVHISPEPSAPTTQAAASATTGPR